MLRMKLRAIGSPRLAVVAIALGLSAMGCPSQESADKALDRALDKAKVSKTPVGKFGGTVTVNGQPPGIKTYDGHRIVLMLYDPKNPPSNNNKIIMGELMPEPQDGTFEFSTFARGDGVPSGSYIALFADMPVSWGGKFHGGDRFENRFNDPDKNEKDDQFKVEIKEPGKTDWHFNLVTEGNPPPSAPGPKAVMNGGR
jgi:hypothetical protein